MDDLIRVFADALRGALGPNAAAFAIAAVGLNLHFGFTGLLNFGHVAFMAIGAYTMAMMVDSGFSLWLGIPAGMLAAVVLGLVLGGTTLRLRVEYLAITTIAVGEIIRISIRSRALEEYTGGVFGLQGISTEFFDLNPFSPGNYGLWRITFSERQMWVMVVGWLVALLCTLIVWALMRAPWGRVVKAIREDEDAARALGKNAFVIKIQSLCIGGVMGALAGMLLAIEASAVDPNSYLPQQTFFVWTVMILGGAATIKGAMAGAVMFWFLLLFAEGLLREGISQGIIPEWLLTSQQMFAVRFVITGLLLMALMIWRPQGVFGRREEVMVGAR